MIIIHLLTYLVLLGGGIVALFALREALRPSVWKELLSDENLERFQHNSFEERP